MREAECRSVLTGRCQHQECCQFRVDRKEEAVLEGTIGEDVSWYSFFLWRTVWQQLLKLQMHITFGLTVSFLGIHGREMYLYLRIFIAILFVITKPLKLSKCLIPCYKYSMVQASSRIFYRDGRKKNEVFLYVLIWNY